MTKFWILSVFIITVLGIATIGPSGTSAQKKESDVVRAASPVPNRYIILLDEETTGAAALEPEVEAQGLYLVSLYGGSVKTVFSSAVKGFVAEMSAEEAKAMAADPSIRSIEEDGYISITATQTGAPWNLDRVDQRNRPIDTQYSYSSAGAGVHAYVIDTGIRPTHVEFGGRASISVDFVGDGQNGFDCNGHGTHVAGTIGAATWGVAKNVYLHGVRVMQCDGNGQISNLISGINWVTTNAVRPAVANISVAAAGSSPALETALTNSINSGIVYSVASGNGNYDACNFTPARTPAAITVGASDPNDVRALYSNYGSCVDLFAPGHQIISTWSSSDTATNTLGGSSMAAPMVAGAAAIYLSANPTASAATVTQVIRSTATTGVLTTNNAASPNLLLYTWLSSTSPTPTPTPTATPTPTPTATPTPTPTATPTPSPTPSSARVTVKKRLQNSTSTSSTAAFPFSATRLAAATFTLVDNTTYQDANVQAFGSSNPIIVTESPVDGYRLTSIDCTQTLNGTTTAADASLDLANKTASIVAQPGADILCTYTSEPLAPTAASAFVTGRVVDANGRGVRGMVLNLLDTETGLTVTRISNSFGFYTFEDLPVSRYYVLSVLPSKRGTPITESRTFMLLQDLADMDFVVHRE
ncbi:MAG: S8 family serine peptidase [Pyrinomonadaceae bacterium]